MQKIFVSFICISILGIMACDKKAELVVENSQSTTTSNESNTPTETTAMTSQVPTNTTENIATITSTPSTGLSTDNPSDIATDLKTMWQVTEQSKINANQTMLILKDALDNKDNMGVQQALENANHAILELNRQYDSIMLKSSEVTNARERIKQHNLIQLEMGKAITAPVPNQAAFNALVEKYAHMQKMIELDMKTLQIKAVMQK